MGVADSDQGYPSQLNPIQKRDWIAAHILHANNIPAALAGPPTAAFYGSDVLWVQVVILVHDPAFKDACEVLCANGYEDILMSQHDYELLQAPDSDPDGKEAVKWRLLSPRERRGGGVILAPASHWHFDITEDTTIIVDGIRFPKFVSYLQALVSLLVQRFKYSIPAGYFKMQALDTWVLRKKYPDVLTKLSPADHFFLERFFLLRGTHNCRKVVELWDSLKGGVLTVEEAVASAPIERYPEHRRKNVEVPLDVVIP